MKIDSFTTARCIKCGWVKQFIPGKEYASEDFVCKCNEVKEEVKPRRGKPNGNSRKSIKEN